MPQTKEKHREYMRAYREKKRESQPVKSETEPITKPEPIEKLIETPELDEGTSNEFQTDRFPIKSQDCLTFRKMISGDLPRDGLFLGDHDVNCPSCNQWRINFERGEESGFVKAHADPFHASGEPDDFGECPEDFMKDFDSSTLKPEQQNDKDDTNVSDNQ